tara:strand:- start:192 stop:692 length:501 start_codon:yes stop_codon:yes gene_type:complete
MKQIEFKLEEGCKFRASSDLDHLKLAMDVSSIRSESPGPTRFFRNVVGYLSARPSIARDRGISNKEMASEFLTLTLLESMVRSDDRPGAMEAFQRCITNSDNTKLIEKFAQVILESIEDGTGAVAGMEFSFDNRGNMTLQAGSAIDEHIGEELDGITIDRHLDGSA